jgi:hypothetical protein
MRRTLPVLLAAALLAPVAAQATPPVPKPSHCGWGDPSGDARAPERDVVCVDLGVSAKVFVVVLRLAGALGRDEAGLVLGQAWSVGFVCSGVRILATLERSAVTGKDRWSMTVGGTSPSLVAAIGRDGATLEWTAKRAGTPLLRPRPACATWSAQTKLAGVADDSADGRTSKG